MSEGHLQGAAPGGLAMSRPTEDRAWRHGRQPSLICDRHGVVVDGNIAFNRAFGAVACTSAGWSLEAVMATLGLAGADGERLSAAIADGRGESVSFAARGDGSAGGAWRLDLDPVFDGANQCEGFVGQLTDISQLAALQSGRSAQEAVFRSAFALSKLGAWSARLDTQQVHLTAEAKAVYAVESLNVSFDEAVLAYAPDHQAAVSKAFRKTFANGEHLSFIAQLGAQAGHIWVQVLGEPDTRDGQVVAINGVVQDITALRSTQSMLDEKDRYAAGVMEAIDERVGVVNANGDLIHVNRVWRDRLQQLSEIRGEAFSANYRDQCAAIPDDYGRELEAGVQGILDGRIDRFSTIFQSKLTDPPQWFKFEAIALPDAGEAKMVVIQHNITELKETAAKLEQANAVLKSAIHEADAANQAKSKFLANLSHEIRTPLNGVVAIADMLARANLGVAEQEMVETIRTSADALSSLLADILDLARIESGRMHLERNPFRLGEAVRAVAALTDLIAREKGVGLSCHICPEADAWVMGDVNRIKQVLTNLVSNAVKFTQEGEVRVLVTPDDRGGFRFDVTDTGVGFEMSDRDRLFDRFEQADSSVMKQFGGSGLGLSIVRELVELMGGELDCRSEIGRGSVFSVYLPMPAATAPIAEPDKSGDDDAHPSGLSVLVVDDHPINRRVMELILRRPDTHLTMAEDGQQAIDILTATGQRFDLVLMDMQMPVMDGLTATRRLRAYEAAHDLPPVPLIMVSANAMPAHVTDSLAAGADFHLAKPLTASGLIEAIRTVMVDREKTPPSGRMKA